MKTVMGRCMGQFGDAFRIDIAKSRTGQGLPAEGVPPEPPTSLLPEEGMCGRSKRDSVAHREKVSFVKLAA